MDINEAISGAVGAIAGVIGGFVGGSKAASNKVATEANEAIRIANETQDRLTKQITFYDERINKLMADNEKCDSNYRELLDKYDMLDKYVRDHTGIPPKRSGK